MGITILPIVLLALPALSEIGHETLSSTKVFTINGKRYLLEKSAENDISLIRRELSREGIDIQLSGSGQPKNPYLVQPLREDPYTTSILTMPLPRGLRAEHVMHMESETGSVGLALGAMDARGPQIRNQLLASGWERIHAGNGQEHMAIATRKKGRETSIVFLEEKEGKFLLARKRE
jgi:hypothetical protein